MLAADQQPAAPVVVWLAEWLAALAADKQLAEATSKSPADLAQTKS